MTKNRKLNKHLWKHNKTGIWYYQITSKTQRYKFSLNTRDVNQGRILRDKFDIEIADHGKIKHQYSEYQETPVLGQVCKHWFEIKKLTCRKHTIVNGYKPKLNAHILNSPFVNKAVDAIEADEIEDWWYTLPCTGSTINGILDILSNIFRFAMKKKWANSNPIKIIDRPKRNSDLPNPFNMREVEILLRNIEEHYLDYQTVRFFTGMRACEQNALFISDIDLENRLINVRRSVVDRIFGETKNEYSKRFIKMNERTYQAIVRQIKRAMKHCTQTLFFNRHQNPIDTRTYNRAVWKPLFQNKNVKNIIKYRHCRCSRHTFISLSLATGENPMFVAKQVGQRDANMIFKKYAAYIKNDHDGSKFDSYLTQSLHNLQFVEGDETSNISKTL